VKRRKERKKEAREKKSRHIHTIITMKKYTAFLNGTNFYPKY